MSDRIDAGRPDDPLAAGADPASELPMKPPTLLEAQPAVPAFTILQREVDAQQRGRSIDPRPEQRPEQVKSDEQREEEEKSDGAPSDLTRDP